jgi:Tol biopolymer transport system component
VKLVRAGTTEAVSGRHITNSVVPWSWLGEQVLFVAPLGDSMDLWSVPLSARDWHVTAARRRLTTGVELVNHPSAAADGRIVFASLRSEVNVWSLAADANTGKVTGRLEQITYGAGQKIRPALSRDGSKLAFGVGASPEKTLGAIVLKDLRTARETPVAMASSLYPTLNADATKIAYVQIARDGKMQIYIAHSSGDVPEKVCDDCGLTPAPWSSNSLKLLYDGGVPQTVGLFDLVTRKKTELLRLPGSAVTQASFSPDDRWICFLATKGPGRSQVHVIPYREGSPAPPQAEWMAVTDGAAFEGLPRWSPDGKLIYFISDRDGFRCLWAQRVNPGNKNPAIAPFAVAHFHEARRSLTNIGGIGLVGLGVSRDRIVFNLGELTGNIWMAQPAPAN